MKLTPLHLYDCGELLALKVRVPIRNLPAPIAGRILSSATDTLPCDDVSVEIREPGPGRGVVCMVSADFEHASELTGSLGEHGVTSEAVGHRAAKGMKHFIDSNAAVSRYLADQLLLPMALAGGGEFTTVKPDNHAATNISVITKFLPMNFRIDDGDRGKKIIRVS